MNGKINKNSAISLALSLISLFFSFLLFIIFLLTNKSDTLTATEIYEKTTKLVVELRAYNDSSIQNSVYGTAVFVSEEGYLVSNAHVITYLKGDEYFVFDHIEIKVNQENKMYTVDVVKWDLNIDLCYLKFDYKKYNVKVESFNLSKANLKSGDRVYAVGNALNHGISITEGIVSIPLIKINLENKSYLVIQSNIVINSGNSGGALVDSKGNLVGITTFRLKDQNGDVIQGIGYSIPNKIILEFLSTFY